jgi:hypothetical protein
MSLRRQLADKCDAPIGTDDDLKYHEINGIKMVRSAARYTFSTRPKFEVLKNIFWGASAFKYHCQLHQNTQSMFTTALLCFPKTYTQAGFEPGSSDHQANEMMTAPRRQDKRNLNLSFEELKWQAANSKYTFSKNTGCQHRWKCFLALKKHFVWKCYHKNILYGNVILS